MKVDLIKVFTDDYEALYINGTREVEEHSIHLDHVLELLIGKEVNSYKTYYIEEHVLESSYSWSFPKLLIDFNGSDLK